MFRRALNSIYNPEPIKCTVPKKPLFISLPYLGKDNFLLKRKLTSLIGRFYPQFKISCCFKSSFTIGSCLNLKIGCHIYSCLLLFISIHADSVRLAMLVKQLSSLKCAYHNIKDAPIEQEII